LRIPPHRQSHWLASIKTRLREQGLAPVQKPKAQKPKISTLPSVGRSMVSRGKTKPPMPSDLDLEGWQEMLEMVAGFVAEDPAFVPVFQRIEAEIARVTKQQDVIARAREIVARHARN
jgi:hypothetical protein